MIKRSVKRLFNFLTRDIGRNKQPEFGKKRSLLYPAFTVQRKAPVSLPGSTPLFLEKVDTNLRAVHLFEYDNVNVTPEGIVFRGFQMDTDLFIYPNHTARYNLVYLLSTLLRRRRIHLKADEKYLLCVDYWSNGIFHWMCDVLPRLQAVKDFARDCVLLMPEDLKYPYFHETLKAFKFKSTLAVADNTYLHFEKLYSPQQVTTSGQMRPDNILSLRKTLLDYFEPLFEGRLNFPKIYVSRNKAKYRKVLNEDVVKPVLEKFGFQLIFFEDYTVSQQIEISFYARVVVSIHGANLSNTIFMKPGGKVLEFRKTGDTMNNYYYELADSVNCDYYYLDCEYYDPEPEKNIFSLYVDPKKLSELFGIMGLRPEENQSPLSKPL